MKKKQRSEKLSLMHRWAERVFDGEWNVIFDESIWTPNDNGSVENLIRLKVKLGNSQEFFIIIIDLRKGYHDCVKVINDKSIVDVDVFSTKFKEK